jgi:hypothetical protein
MDGAALLPAGGGAALPWPHGPAVASVRGREGAGAAFARWLAAALLCLDPASASARGRDDVGVASARWKTEAAMDGGARDRT